MRNRTKKLIFIASVTTVLVLGFQNCSKVDFAPAAMNDGAGFAKGGGDLVAVGSDPAPADLITGDIPNSEIPNSNIPNSDIPATTTDPTTPVADSNDQALPPAGDATLPPVAEEDSSQDQSHDPVIEPATGDEQQAAAIDCRNARELKKVLSMKEDGAEINHFRGSMTIKAHSIALISDTRGKMVVLGTGDDASIAKIEDHRGLLVVCDMNVGELLNNRGKVIIVNGDVAKVDDFRGLLRVKDGTIGTATNVRGRLEAKK